MRFAFIPKGQYKIGQIITVHNQPMRVESYTHTGRNVVVHTLENAPKFQRIHMHLHRCTLNYRGLTWTKSTLSS
jgi:hypothetical protein